MTPTCPACKQHDPGPQCTGCHYTCLTCGLHLHGKNEVWGHWMLSFSGHSIFVDTKGHHYHQTVEGLHRRQNWDGATASSS